MLTHTLAEGWLEVVPVPLSEFRPINPGIDAGEASAIATACTWQAAGDAVLLVMDDRAGRMEAKNRGIALIGTAVVIGLAKTQGCIPAARPLLERLVESGDCTGPAVVAAVLHEVGKA